MRRSDTNCILKIWYNTLPPSKITLNVLCPACLHHQSFYQFHIEPYFSCENNPIGHPGTCVIKNAKPIDVMYFTPHCYPLYYICPTLENCQCHSVCINKTREEQDINTVNFSPNFTIPCMTLGDAKTCASHYISQLFLPKSCQTYTINQVHYKLN